MNRRDFVQAIGAALTTAVVPASGKTITLKKSAPAASSVVFNPGLEYGRAVHLTERTEKSVEVAREMVMRDARELLPVGTRFYVLDGGEAMVHGAEGQERIDMIAWLYTPRAMVDPLSRRVIAEVRA